MSRQSDARTEALRAEPEVARGALRACLFAAAFTAGFAITGVEIALGRLLAPHFGSSLAVWASIMAAIIGALALGYPLGGWLADRRPGPRLPFAALLIGAGVSALLALLVPAWLHGAMQGIGLSGLAYWSRLAIALGAFAAPCLVMAAVTPAVLRATLRGRETVGFDAGRLYALGSLGSVLGILLPALWWIPLLGLRTSFALISALAVLPGAVGLLLCAGRRGVPPVAVTAVAVALTVLLPNVLYTEVAGAARVLYDRDSGLQRIRVLADDRGEYRRRWLQLDEGWSVHSTLLEPELVTGDVWDWMALSLLATQASDGHTDVAILGLAGGTVSNLMTHYLSDLVPDLHITGVELDPQVIAVADAHLGLDRARLTTVAADARTWLRSARGRGQRFDLIVLDAYRQPSIPAHLSTREFFVEVRATLAPGGLAVLNVFATEGPSRLLAGLAATWQSAFPGGQLLQGPPADGFASRLLLSRRAAPLSHLWTRRVASALHPALRVWREDILKLAGCCGAPLPAAWTDDRAPVELLSDLSYRATRPPNARAGGANEG